MPATRRTHRRTILCTLACALLASAIGAPVAPAAKAVPEQAAALAQEDYYASYGAPQPSSAALAQERYYSTYGQPEPLTVAQSPAVSDDTPWLPIALSLAIVLMTAVASAILLHRVRTRRGAAGAAV